MTRPVTRRAFLLGVFGAAAAGWVWFRDRGLTADGATPAPPATGAPAATTTSAPTTTPATSLPAPSVTPTPTTTAAPDPIRIEALCREAWRAAEPTGEFTDHAIERMTVHHTGRKLRNNRTAPEAILGHQRFHQRDRGWADIAYHFIIDLEGNVYECRPVTAVGDTGTNYDPTGHFLVCCEGNFDEQELPEAQHAALVNVLAWAARQFNVPARTIRGHRDVAATTCPGANLYPEIESGALAQAVRERIAGGGVELTVVCGDEAAARVAAIEA